MQTERQTDRDAPPFSTWPNQPGKKYSALSTRKGLIRVLDQTHQSASINHRVSSSIPIIAARFSSNGVPITLHPKRTSPNTAQLLLTRSPQPFVARTPPAFASALCAPLSSALHLLALRLLPSAARRHETRDRQASLMYRLHGQ